MHKALRHVMQGIGQAISGCIGLGTYSRVHRAGTRNSRVHRAGHVIAGY